jgi:hypothetical protein
VVAAMHHSHNRAKFESAIVSVGSRRFMVSPKTTVLKSLLHNLPFGPDWSDFQHLRTT